MFMRFNANRIAFAILGALIVPCFGRIALNGTGHEHDYYRYIVPFSVGGLGGYLIGLMKDSWLASRAKLIKTNKVLKAAIEANKRAEEDIRKSEKRYRHLFENTHSVMLIIDPENANIVDANPAAISFYGWSYKELLSKKITDINALNRDQVFQEMEMAKRENRNSFIFTHRLSNGEIRDVEVFSGPIRLKGKKLLFSIVHDTTDRVKAEKERDKLIKELRDASKEINTLRGIIPICSSCKKIRNDEGAWNQLEAYISERSEIKFSHGICPDCAKKLYPDLDV